MVRVLVHLVGHRARPSMAWQVAVVLATTGRTRRCPADSTNVGRPAFAGHPRIRGLTQRTKLQQDATTSRGSDEETIAGRALANNEKRSTRHCAAHSTTTSTMAETRRQLMRRCEVGNQRRYNWQLTEDHWCGRSGNTSSCYGDLSARMWIHRTWQLTLHSTFHTTLAGGNPARCRIGTFTAF